jgi:DNA-directed RNA polymerase subunit beta'
MNKKEFHVRDMFAPFEKPKDPQTISAMKVALASPKKIGEWSHGEVKKPETINYRTFKPEKDGLFCAKIFGPVKDYECNCGKYKRMKHRGIVCEKCGVEVIHSRVRRERFGQIQLATSVAHIWFLRSIPSRIGSILDITLKELEKVLYCVDYIVISPADSNLKQGDIINESVHDEMMQKYGENGFKAEMGAEAIRALLETIDIERLAITLRDEIKGEKSDAKKKKLAKRLKVVEAFRDSGNRPEWMILKNIPVLPPDLRPLVPLDGGRFATSDLNDLYRRVINRNNRLKRLFELNAPEIIIRNEKRMLQESVDALFDNGRRGRVITGANKRPLKSLSDMLKGKQGRFRQNLLGKRVDYSGRSVIVIGPELKLHQCGLPKMMALELFKPFIYNKLEEKGYATTIKVSKKLVDLHDPKVWDILEEVTREHPVFLNRAPTLHRLGIQAFEPVLVEGKAIQIHPLVCVAYNADFDGDQMAVHLPLSVEAQMEARVLMMSTNNILSPSHGKAVISPTQDIVLGIYYLTKEKAVSKGEGKLFSGPREVRIAYDSQEVDLQAKIKCRMRIYSDEKKHAETKIVETTVGRVLLSEIMPEEISFDLYNRPLDKKALANLLDIAYKMCGSKKTVLLADRLRTWGYQFSTIAGISISIDDMKVPEKKPEILANAKKTVNAIESQHRDGQITAGERYNKVIDAWSDATDLVAKEMMNEIGTETYTTPEGKEKQIPSFNPIFIMADSGARGSALQMRQLAGMRGLMSKPSGEIIETPITANFREGLTVLQYFISTHGARKGLADTALKTANSGYLTRRLVDVAQDVVIIEKDCGTVDGIEVTALVHGGEIREPLGERILGRVALEDIENPYLKEPVLDEKGRKTVERNKIIVRANEEIDEKKVEEILNAAIEKVKVRSVLTCRTHGGACVFCYGRDLARGKLVNIGETVGVIAAQSIGEPGTQLTMRTFHIGGTAGRMAEQSSIESRNKGIIKYINLNTVTKKDGSIVVMNRNGEISIIDESGREKEKYPVPYSATMLVKDSRMVKENQRLAQWDPWSNSILTEVGGKVKFDHIKLDETLSEQVDEVTGVLRKVIIESKDPEARPCISITDEKEKILKIPNLNMEARYFLPVGANITVNEDSVIEAGEVIAKIPKEIVKMKDITGGLPRVAELFEARKPKEHALISEIDGRVSFSKGVKGKRKIIITPEVGEKKEYIIPKGKYVSLREGDFVKAGDPLMDGSSNPHDILRVLGIQHLAKYLVDEVQEVYRLQGVKIHDKHIEVIVRQMLRWVKILDPGDTKFLADEHVDKWTFEEENRKVKEKNGNPATGEDILLGITKASLNVESFISAASFQETTKVLTEASICGKTDYLKGLKENVIMGRLIPAGTGFPMLNREVDISFSEEIQNNFEEAKII